MKILAPIDELKDIISKEYADGKFLSALSVNGDNLQYTLNGANKLVTVPYATSAANVRVTSVSPTSATIYYPTFVSGLTGGTNYPLVGNSVIRWQLLEGTTSALGLSQFILGNGTASGTAKNSEGSLSLYGSNTGSSTLKAKSQTSNYTQYLPSANGTLVYHTTGSAIGSTSLPVYVDAAGKVTACTASFLTTGNYATTLDSSYVKKAGDTMTGKLSLPTLTITDTNASAHIQFSRASYNYINAPANGIIAIMPNNGGQTSTAGYYFDGTKFYAGTTNSKALGGSTLRWSNVYSVKGDFSGQITSSVANGTAPFVVASTTLVKNLNADMLDGIHSSGFVRTTVSTSLYQYQQGNWLKFFVITQPSATTLNTAFVLDFYNYETGASHSFGRLLINIRATALRSADIVNWGSALIPTIKITSDDGLTYSLWMKCNKETWHPYMNCVLVNYSGTATYQTAHVYQDEEPTGTNTNHTVLVTGYAARLTTPRTLWGQSFDGGANVSGNLTGVGNITGSGQVLISSTGASNAIALRQNNTDATSVVLNSTAFKPYDNATNKLNLGTSSARWLGIYGNTLNLSGTITVATSSEKKSSIGIATSYSDVWRYRVADSDGTTVKEYLIPHYGYSIGWNQYTHTDGVGKTNVGSFISDYFGLNFHSQDRIVFSRGSGDTYQEVVKINNSGLSVTNAVTVGSTLSVAGASTLTGAVTTGSTLTVNGSKITLYGANSSAIPEVLFYRNGASSWKLINSAGNFYFQNNYTTAVQSSYFNVLTLAYNTGHATLKGSLTTGGNIVSSTNNAYTLGSTSARWANAYLTNLNVSGTATITSIKIGDATLSWDGTYKALKVDGTIYATGGVSALGEGVAGSGGAAINVIDNLLSTNTSDALSANQGRVLNQNITAISSRVSSLSSSVSSLQTSTFTGKSSDEGYTLTWFTASGGGRDVTIPTYDAISGNNISEYDGTPCLVSEYLVSDLQDWVTGRGYLTSSSLSGYLNTSNTYFTQKLTSGTEIGTIRIGGKDTKIYAPVSSSGGSVDLSGYVTLNTQQTITGAKAFNDSTDFRGDLYGYEDNVQTWDITTNGAARFTTVNGYTLAAACAKSVTDSSSASAIGTGTSLVTERDVYYGLPKINNAHSYNSNTNVYAPTAGGATNQYLKGNGTTAAPVWQTYSTSPTSGSTALITSGAVYTALANQKVTVTQTLTSGTAIGSIKVGNASAVTLYAPSSSGSGGGANLSNVTQDITIANNPNDIDYGSYYLYFDAGLSSKAHIYAMPYANMAELHLYADTLNVDAFTMYAFSIQCEDVTQTSDIRYKEVLEDMNIPLSRYAGAPSFKFLWADREDGREHIGSSAQYWQSVDPLFVSENRKDGKLSLDYTMVSYTGVITVAKETEDLKKRVNILEKENVELKERIALLEYKLN